MYGNSNYCYHPANYYWNQGQPYYGGYNRHPSVQPSPSTINANTSQFTPDQWVQYIQPLVQRALEEVNEGINLTHLFQEFILSGVLVGKGYTPEMAIEQVEKWEKGESKLLQQSKLLRRY